MEVPINVGHEVGFREIRLASSWDRVGPVYGRILDKAYKKLTEESKLALTLFLQSH